ncbi:hypothetical protein MLD38_015833 [Melastoma candidum]|uniref:Uncharacterized protein n=1 Tax=Melastoma candidum TaxID=119954 RepID=A0ACB9RH19_9MYRT|nr:hypothetical protein MLD38_015833 [Melastoma candidum]
MAQESGKEKSPEHEEDESVELVLFQVSECYVYMIPPRKTAASYRADEWDVNKWTWEGVLKVISKGEECIIRLEDKASGTLYARAFLRNGEPHPVEPVIDSSRYFVLRVEENIGGRLRHAFIGIGFRERNQAYDFQAALHDHAKYLNKKKEAEEMEQHYQHAPFVDYSLKEGETIVIPVKNKNKTAKLKVTEGLSNLTIEEKGDGKLVCLKPPPPPSAPVSPMGALQSHPPPGPFSSDAGLEKGGRTCTSPEVPDHPDPKGKQRSTGEEQDGDDFGDDFGDFQAAV